VGESFRSGHHNQYHVCKRLPSYTHALAYCYRSIRSILMKTQKKRGFCRNYDLAASLHEILLALTTLLPLKR